MKKLFQRKKFVIFISLAAVLLAIAAFWRFYPSAISPNKANNQAALTADLSKLNLPSEFKIGGDETVPLIWADDNSNENLIIQSDRRYYSGNGQTEVYFSVTNASGVDQQTDVYFWFDGSDKSVASVEKIQDGKTVDARHPDIAQSLDVGRLAKRKDIRGYTAGSTFDDAIAANQTNFYKAVIKYPASQNQSEFFIEAFGEKGGYGLLDPYLTSGLVGYWSFNGADMGTTSATDLSSNNNTGWLNGGVKKVTGISGQGLSFDGVDDYVTVTDDDSLSFGNGTTDTAFTLSLWTKMREATNDRFVYKGTINSGKGEYGFSIRTADDALVIFAYDESVHNCYIGRATGAFTNNTDQWIHIVATYDGSGVSAGFKIYLNDARVDNADYELNAGSYVAMENLSDSLHIGDNGIGGYADGLIDEVRIYNRALSVDEITDLYRHDTARAKINTSESNFMKDSSLVGYWTFDGADMGTTSATDLSENSNTGWLLNGVKKVSGISGQALQFDGVDDYVDVGDISAIENVSQMTLSSWVFIKSLSPTGGVFTKGTVSTSIVDMKIYGSDSNDVFVRIANGHNSYGVTTGNILTTGSWHFWTAVFDGTQADNSSRLKFYFDGVEQVLSYTLTIPATTPSNVSTAKIGYYESVPAYFNGSLDETRLYNRALSADEISNLYRAGSAKMTVNAPVGSGAAGMSSSLTGYWSFDGPNTIWTSATAGTTNDLSGFYATGTMNNMSRSTSPAAGLSGQALKFDGVDDYLSMGDKFDMGLSNASMSVWIKTSSSTVLMGIAGKNQGAGTIGRWGLFTSTSLPHKVAAMFSPTIVGLNLISTTTIDNNAWHQVAVTYNRTGNMILYVDGVLQSQRDISAFSATNFNNALNFTIGQYYDAAADPAYFFNGSIDDVRVYSRALSADEIQQLYRQGTRKTQIKAE